MEAIIEKVKKKYIKKKIQRFFLNFWCTKIPLELQQQLLLRPLEFSVDIFNRGVLFFFKRVFSIIFSNYFSFLRRDLLYTAETFAVNITHKTTKKVTKHQNKVKEVVDSNT